MTQTDAYSDEELVAFLDGEADDALRAKLSAALDDDLALAARLDALRFDQSALSTGFDAALNLAPDLPDFLATPERDTNFGWMKVAAACLIGVLLAGGGYFAGQKQEQLAGQGAAGWTEYVAAYQALYGTETLAYVAQSPGDRAEELARASSALDRVIDLDVLQSVPGLTFRRAQLLQFEGAPLVQIAFVSQSGAPVALCLIAKSSPSSSGVELLEMEALQTALWSDSDHDFMLIGTDDAALIEQAAAHFSQMM